jgi:exoribonuclease II
MVSGGCAGQNRIIVAVNEKYLGALVEYLNEGKLRPGLVVREQASMVTVLDASGHERAVARDLVMLRHPERKATRETLAATLGALEEERSRLAGELDLNLLWEVVREHGRGYTAEELADLFFGHRSAAGAAVMLEALLNDRLFFVRRNMEFVARSADQAERLRTQHERIRLRSEAGRRTRNLIRSILEDGVVPPASETDVLIGELRRYLDNPFTRNRDLTLTLEAAINDISPGEAAYEILERLNAAPPGSRFAVIGGVRTTFSEAAIAEAQLLTPPERALVDDSIVVAIDDEDTIEVDDAVSCERTPDGGFRVRIHIALVADYVRKGGPMDQEAAARGSTVYLPETTIRMLPDRISTEAASLIAGQERHVLTTDVRLSSNGELIDYSLYPGRLRISVQISYEQADRLLCGSGVQGGDIAAALRQVHEAATKLRERRRSAGAVLIQRREPKVSVVNGKIDVKLIDNASPSRQLVAELMVLSNHAAARLAADRNIPMIYRVQPGTGGDPLTQRPHLSLYPEFHAGVGLNCYLQASSPIRRYMDLVLQRQLLAALSERSAAYQPDELLNVLAAAESAEADGKELERRAKRYWILRYLELNALNRPLEAIVLRDGASAELEAYAVRGTLHGAPNVASQTRVLVQIARVEPVRGWLTMDYLGPVTVTSSEGDR